MAWLVGLDVYGRSHGAVRFARWFSAKVQAHAAPISGVHVLDLALFDPLIGEVPTGDLEKAALLHLRKMASELGLDPTELDIEVAAAESVGEAIIEQIEKHSAEGLILGRKADRHSHALVRLGRVARHLTRELPCPVLVVPPDHDPSTPKGPIVVASDLTDNSAAAAALARKLAKPLGRAIVVTHTMLGLEQRLRPWFPDQPGGEVEARMLAQAQAKLDAWCADQGLAGVDTKVLVGDPLLETRDFLTRMDACMGVVGSRRLGLAARAVRVSFGSHLAATATCPVCLVAPPAND